MRKRSESARRRPKIRPRDGNISKRAIRKLPLVPPTMMVYNDWEEARDDEESSGTS